MYLCCSLKVKWEYMQMVFCTQTWCGVAIISCLLPVQVVLIVLYLCYSCTRITEGYIRHEMLEWVRWSYSVLLLFSLFPATFVFMPFLSYVFTPPSSQGLASFISSPSWLSALRLECCHPFVDKWVCTCRNVHASSGECVLLSWGGAICSLKGKRNSSVWMEQVCLSYLDLPADISAAG